MNDKIKWTPFQIILETLCTLFFLGFIIWLILNWNTFPERIPAHLHAMGKSLSETSKKAFAIVPFQMFAFMLYIILTPIEFVPSAWTNLSCYKGYTPPEAYRLTRTFLILLKSELVLLFDSIIISMIYPQTDPLLTITIIVLMLFTIMAYLLLLYCYRHQQ